MKKIFGIILCLALIFSCAAFAESDDGQSMAMNVIGDYSDQTSERAVIHIDCGDETDVAAVQINWANSWDETVVWKMSGPVEEQDGGFVLKYTDCTKCIVKADSDTAEGTEETVYENGTGTLTWDQENNITWQDDIEDAGADCLFAFDQYEENTFTAAGVSIDGSEADIRAALGDPAEEKAINGGKELVYTGVSVANIDMEAHFIIMDDMTRAMCFSTHNGGSDAANDISEFMEAASNDAECDISEKRTQELGTKYFGITDFSQLTYFAKYAKDGTLLVYLRTSETDIHLLALDQYLQEQ